LQSSVCWFCSIAKSICYSTTEGLQRVAYGATVDCKVVFVGFAELQSQNVIMQRLVCNGLFIMQRLIAKKYLLALLNCKVNIL
jgi:hypothetical protein